VPGPQDPSADGSNSATLMLMLGWLLIATILFLVRPASMRRRTDQKENPNGGGDVSTTPQTQTRVRGRIQSQLDRIDIVIRRFMSHAYRKKFHIETLVVCQVQLRRHMKCINLLLIIYIRNLPQWSHSLLGVMIMLYSIWNWTNIIHLSPPLRLSSLGYHTNRNRLPMFLLKKMTRFDNVNYFVEPQWK